MNRHEWCHTMQSGINSIIDRTLINDSALTKGYEERV
jgi:hypothetical protein